MNNIMKIIGILLIVSWTWAVQAQDQALPTEADYYPVLQLPIPDGVVLEASAIEMMPDGKLAVASRRGDIYLVDQPLAKTAEEMQFSLYASGLHEILGLSFHDGGLFTTQRCEVTKIVDLDKNGTGDLFQSVSDVWEIGGDYHEYAFGSKVDPQGNTWVVLCLTGSFNSNIPYRGWCLRIGVDGKVTPTCSGIRSPGGIGTDHLGNTFYTDNQGPWNGTCGLKWLKPGSFQGHPGGNRWYELTDALGDRPADPTSGSRIMTEFDKNPILEPTAVFFPYNKMGKSASGIICDTSGGKFGPFKNQLFVGDQSYSTIMRVFMEKIDGHYQGACFPFREGLASGSLSMQLDPSGALFVGGTNRGWGSRGSKPFALERMNWSGKVPFEVHEMRAKPDGFELTFTQPVDKASIENLASYKISTYTYIYQSSYGSPEVDHTEPVIKSAVLSADAKSVYLTIDGLQRGHVHEIHMDGIRNSEGLPLLHKQAYYTLNFIPGK
jgi:hypothetical protein